MYYSKFEIIFSKIPSILFWFIAILLSVLLGFVSSISPFITLITFCVFVIILSLLVRPEYAMYITAMLIIAQEVLRIVFWNEVVLDFADLGGIILLLSWCFARIVSSRKYIPGILAQHHVYYLLFLLWSLVTILWANNQLNGTGMLIVLLVGFSTLYISANILASPKIFHATLLLLIFVGVLNAVLALLYPYFTYSLHTEIPISENVRCTLQFWYNPHNPHAERLGRTMGLALAHYTATYMLVPIISSIMLFFVTKSKKKRIVLILLSLIMYASMVSTMSKTAVISLFIGIVYVMFYIIPLKRLYLINLFKLLMITIIVFCFVRVQNIIPSISRYLIDLELISAPEERITSVGNRLGTLKLGFEKLYDSVGLGCGIGSFRGIAKSHGLTIDSAHPEVLFDLGVLGIMLWMLILTSAYLLFIRTIRNTTDEYYRRMLVIYIGGYICIIASWVFSTSYANNYLWFYLGIGYALVYMSEKYPMKEVTLPFHKPGDTIVDI